MKGMPGNMMNECMKKMHGAGISEDTIHQWQVIANTPVQMDDPAAILGQADALGLSKEQRQKLSDSLKESREKANSILTEDQKKKMGKISSKPMTMMEMWQSMCGKMGPMMKEKMKGMPGGPM